MNLLRVWLDREIAAFANSLDAGALVLDAGSGNQMYRPKFERQHYELADFEQVKKKYEPSTYVCDLASISVDSERYDAILFTQVMEHLPEPGKVLDELFRIMKPGGVIFYTAPLFYEEHEIPYDFYRYTQFGVRHRFQSAGFVIEELRWLAGYMATVAYQFQRFSKHAPMSPSALGGGFVGFTLAAFFVVLKPVTRLVASLAKRSEVKVRITDRGFAMNYLAIARKPTR